MNDASQPAYCVPEAGVPIPPRRDRGDPNLHGLISALEVGQSVLIPKDIKHSRISCRCCVIAKRKDRKFTTRATNQGVRVWRVK
jgi:uncharacterized protein (DUF2249 family)